MYTFRFIIAFFRHYIHQLEGFSDTPFMQEFIQNILKNKNPLQSEVIEQHISALRRDNTILEPFQAGAGSRSTRKGRTVSKTSRIISVNRKYGRLLYKIIKCYKPEVIIELGTGFGISTMYMSLGQIESRIFTVEENPQLAVMAKKNFLSCNLNNITVLNSSFDGALDQLKSFNSRNIMVFIDGNHTSSATLKYFNTFVSFASIIVFDDITWSADMIETWKIIENSPYAGISIDLFKMGIIFPRQERRKYALCY